MSKRSSQSEDELDEVDLSRAKKARTGPSTSPGPLRALSKFRRPQKTSGDREERLDERHHDDDNVVMRKYYPPIMSNERCQEYNDGRLARPLDSLEQALKENQSAAAAVKVGAAVVHWFKSDLRIHDNTALAQASKKASGSGVSLIGLYVVSPQDWEAHLTAPVRIDFIFRTLTVLRQDLACLDIPLYVEVVAKRRNVPGRIVALMEEWGARHLYANIEYEVDELRRETIMVSTFAARGWCFGLHHDTCAIPPGLLLNAQGKPYSVYSPWFRAWMSRLRSDASLMLLSDQPRPNTSETRVSCRHLFSCNLEEMQLITESYEPFERRLSSEERRRFNNLWPAGEAAAQQRLRRFMSDRINKYKSTRNFPADTGTSCLSVHLASGTLSARQVIKACREVDDGTDDTNKFIAEVAWRDFYKHILAFWPQVCMSQQFQLTTIQWKHSRQHFEAWTKGMTGFPIVDSAMRQLNFTGYMHNRLRMVTAMFLTKDLLIDWRLGERYFMLHLVDGDFASNNGGWQWCADTGSSPQPYVRIFNPISQSEKFDANGDFIRKWIPELRNIAGPAIHDPHERGQSSHVGAYPRKIVDHNVQRQEALRIYREGREIA